MKIILEDLYYKGENIPGFTLSYTRYDDNYDLEKIKDDIDCIIESIKWHLDNPSWCRESE